MPLARAGVAGVTTGPGAMLGRLATRKVGIDDASTTPAEKCGASTYDGNIFPISTSFKLNDPACRRDIRTPPVPWPEFERSRDPGCCAYPNGTDGIGGADAGAGTVADFSMCIPVRMFVVAAEYAFTGGGR